MTPPAVDALLDALALPPAARVDRRIAKTTLSDHAPTPALKRLARDGVARLNWVAELSPVTCGVPVSADPPAPAVNVLVLAASGTPTRRLIELIHRLIPAPVVLLSTGGTGITVSLAPLRRAERVEDVVLDRLILVSDVREGEADRAFADSLAVPALPRADLHALYDGLVVRAEALAAARAGGGPFRLPLSPADALDRRGRLAVWEAAGASWTAAKAAAAKEKRLAEAVRLGDKAAAARRELETARAALNG